MLQHSDQICFWLCLSVGVQAQVGMLRARLDEEDAALGQIHAVRRRRIHGPAPAPAPLPPRADVPVTAVMPIRERTAQPVYPPSTPHRSDCCILLHIAISVYI